MIDDLKNEEYDDGDNLDDLLSRFGDNDDVDLNVFMDLLDLNMDELEQEMASNIPLIEVSYSKDSDDVKDPEYAYPTDSGFDLYSIEDKWLHPFDRQLIRTGLHIDIPENYEIQVRSKSGLALKQGLMVLNSPGTVDQGYTGEIQVILFNTTNQKVKVEKGQKVAQAVVCPVVAGKWLKFSQKQNIESKDRNNNGFGSTGL